MKEFYNEEKNSSNHDSDDQYFMDNFMIFKAISDIYLFGNLTPSDEGEFKVTFTGSGIPADKFKKWDDENFDQCGHKEEDTPSSVFYTFLSTQV